MVIQFEKIEKAIVLDLKNTKKYKEYHSYLNLIHQSISSNSLSSLHDYRKWENSVWKRNPTKWWITLNGWYSLHGRLYENMHAIRSGEQAGFPAIVAHGRFTLAN